MLDDLVRQFVASGAGQEVIQQLTGQGLTTRQAQDTVEATASSAAQQVSGGGGLGGMLGGLGGALGGMLGGGSASSGVPQQLVETIAREVSTRTGLSQDMAKMAVNAVLPKVIEFVKSQMGASPANPSEITAP